MKDAELVASGVPVPVAEPVADKDRCDCVAEDVLLTLQSGFVWLPEAVAEADLKVKVAELEEEAVSVSRVREAVALVVSVGLKDLLLVPLSVGAAVPLLVAVEQPVAEPVADSERCVKVALPVGDPVGAAEAVPLAVNVIKLRVGEPVPVLVEETVG